MCDSERKLDLALVQSVVQRAACTHLPNDREHCKLALKLFRGPDQVAECLE